MKPHAFHPQAAEEYAEAASYYSRIYPQLGTRFHDEIERLILEIRKDPRRFKRFDAPAQRHFSNVFPYAVIFVENADRIWVLAVMHMKRGPGYWKGRA